MACVTLKRQLESDLQTTTPPRKRARYSIQPLPSASAILSDVDPSASSPQQSHTSPFNELTRQREEMAVNIKHEIQRLTRSGQLVVNQQQQQQRLPRVTRSQAMVTKNESNQQRKQQGGPMFTYTQVGLICEKVLKNQEQRIREEYEEVLRAKLAEQFDTFVKFAHDHVQRQFSGVCPSYMS